MPSKPPRISPADELADEPTGRLKSWWLHMDEQDLADIREIRRRHLAGFYRTCAKPKGVGDIYKFCARRFGLKVQRNTFEAWLRGDADHPV